MPDSTRRGGRAVAAVLLSAGLVACNGPTEPTEPRTQRPADGAGRTPSPSTSPEEHGPETTLNPAAGPLDELPARPSTGDAAALAEQLMLVESVLADPSARAADVRRAAEFEQLAARVLAVGPGALAESVLGRLGPAVRARTRAHVEAAALLDGMQGPVTELPDWRIVEPPAPSVLLGHYREAERRIGVPWQYLAAVHMVETRMGRIRGVSSAGAQGPMQFLPTTWDIYGEGGDINDPRDAILAAARLLRANGAPGDLAQALWHYNPSDSYVGAVLRYAEQIRRSPAAYRGYWHWRVLYEHVDGTLLLDVGYPDVRPRRID